MESQQRIMRWLLLAVLLSVKMAFSQKLVPRDTSFTVYSTYIKEKKRYSFIEIVQPMMPKGVRTEENKVYKTIHGRALHIDVYSPTSKPKKLRPGVLLIHGGGWRSGDRTQNAPVAQQLAAHGFVAVNVEYRLTPEASYPAAVQDIKAAIKWMRAHASAYALDSGKIAILGFSAGGQLAALAGTTNYKQKFEDTSAYPGFSSVVQAIIDIDGVLAFKHPESEEGAVAAQWLGGTYEEKPGIWQEASPLYQADKHTPPILFINSSNPRFHAGRNDMIAALQTAGIYTEVHEIPDTPHTFWLFHPWFSPTMSYITAFLHSVFDQ